jgi:DNA-binding MarR family transcriptional regulator
MEKRRLIRRERQTKDRRVILAFITEEGLTLLRQMDPVIPNTIKSALGHLGERKLKDLCRLLEQARNGGE